MKRPCASRMRTGWWRGRVGRRHAYLEHGDVAFAGDTLTFVGATIRAAPTRRSTAAASW